MSNRKEYMKKWRAEHQEQVKRNRKLYYENHCEEEKLYTKQYAKENPEKVDKATKNYRKNNREKYLEQKRMHRKNNPDVDIQYCIKNREKIKKYWKQYRRDNPEKIKIRNKNYRIKNRAKATKYVMDRWKTDLKFNLKCKISSAIRIALKGNKAGRHWEILVGYTLNDLIKRLKKTIPEGYTWEDFLIGKLHIDHRIPISAFNFTKPEHTDFKKCWALSNLRLLPAKENIIKSNKLTKPFQPALAI